MNIKLLRVRSRTLGMNNGWQVTRRNFTGLEVAVRMEDFSVWKGGPSILFGIGPLPFRYALLLSNSTDPVVVLWWTEAQPIPSIIYGSTIVYGWSLLALHGLLSMWMTLMSCLPVTFMISGNIVAEADLRNCWIYTAFLVNHLLYRGWYRTCFAN